jgi:hypothetical protein
MARKSAPSGRAARRVIDVHRRKTALVAMRVPERQLLAATMGTEGVVDIEDGAATRSGRIVARTGLRMMPTFPRSPLTFRKASFPRYG